jgi:hypothetical protein
VKVIVNGMSSLVLGVLKEVLEPDDQIAIASPVNVTEVPGVVAPLSWNENTSLAAMIPVTEATVVPNPIGCAYGTAVSEYVLSGEIPEYQKMFLPPVPPFAPLISVTVDCELLFPNCIQVPVPKGSALLRLDCQSEVPSVGSGPPVSLATRESALKPSLVVGWSRIV